jgi:hypothetical protein
MALDTLFSVMCAAHAHCGCNVPSRFFEEASRIVQHHTQTVASRRKVLPGNETPEPEGHIFGQNFERNGREWLKIVAPNHSPDFLCEVVTHGLEQFFSPDLMSLLKHQNSISGPNLLLVAAMQLTSVEFLRELLREGRTPREMVTMEPIRALCRAETIPATQATVSVWVMFLYCFVEHYLLDRSITDAQNGCFEEFLQYDVDRDVLFVVGIPASSDKPNEAADGDQPPERKSGELDGSVVFDLLEFLELVEPSNIETLRMKLSSKGTREDRLEVTPICPPPIPYQRGSLSKALATIVAAENTGPYHGFGMYLCLESVITPSERLDVPFAFRIS